MAVSIVKRNGSFKSCKYKQCTVLRTVVHNSKRHVHCASSLPKNISKSIIIRMSSIIIYFEELTELLRAAEFSLLAGLFMQDFMCGVTWCIPSYHPPSLLSFPSLYSTHLPYLAFFFSSPSPARGSSGSKLSQVGGSEQNRSVIANVQSACMPSPMHAATYILQEKTHACGVLKRHNFRVHVSLGSAETLVRRGVIINHHSIAYSLSNIFAKKLPKSVDVG